MAITIVTRAGKGSPLTHTEVDTNFTRLNAFKVEQSSTTGSAFLPTGTTAQRDVTPTLGAIRHNTTDTEVEWYNGTGWLHLIHENTVIGVTKGGTGATTAGAARTNLGATTLGSSFFTLTDVAAIAFPRINANNTVSSLTASEFRTAIGAGTVTSVGGTGTVAGLTLTGTVSGSGNLTLGGTLTVAAGDITSGTIATARLGSGTANSTTYLRGDQTWATIVSGATISNDVTTNASYYPIWATANTGTPTTVYVSDTKLYFNPSTGTLNATNFNSLSDLSLKQNVVNVNGATDTVKLIDGVEFEWKDTGKKSAGVIAQKLEEILPHLVDTSDTGIKSVNYSGLVAYLIESVKELSNRVEQLERAS